MPLPPETGGETRPDLTRLSPDELKALQKGKLKTAKIPIKIVPQERLRKPDWIRVRAPVSKGYAATHEIVRANGRHSEEETQEEPARAAGSARWQLRPLAFEFAEKLKPLLPKDVSRVFFTNSGSESVDTAQWTVQRRVGWRANRREDLLLMRRAAP